MLTHHALSVVIADVLQHIYGLIHNPSEAEMVPSMDVLSIYFNLNDYFRFCFEMKERLLFFRSITKANEVTFPQNSPDWRAVVPLALHKIINIPKHS